MWELCDRRNKAELKQRVTGGAVHETKLITVSWPLAPQTCEFLQLCAVKSTAAGWQQGVVIKA